MVMMPAIKNTLINNKKQQLRDIIHIAYSIIEEHHHNALKNQLNLEETKKNLLHELKNLRYGGDLKEYIWVNTIEPVMLMHPFLDSLEGKYVGDFEDPAGKRLFWEMVLISKDKKEGFINYQWQWKDDTSKIIPKLSYVKVYEPWNWIVGTGVYMADIEEEMNNVRYKLNILIWGLILILLLVLVFILWSDIKIVKRKEKVELALQYSESRYKTYMNNAPEGIAILNPSFEIIESNQKFKDSFHKTSPIPQDLNSFLKLTPNEFNALKTKIANRGKYSREVVHYYNKKRENYLLDLSAIPDNCFIAFFVNITNLKIYEEELIKSKLKAEQSDKLKSAFLANMSHEIRTPVNGILGFVRLLEKNNVSKHKRKEYLEIIDLSTKQLLILISDIIDISKIESGLLQVNYTYFDVYETLIGMYKFFKHKVNELNPSLSFSLSCSDSIKGLKIYSDEIRFKQVILNLLNNALKFTPTGKIILGCTRTANQFHFFVEDTGIGIEAELQDKIFDRFTQALDEDGIFQKGTGLGLAISKGIAELLGGKLEVRSTKNRGSRFTFTLNSPIKEANP